ncbi:arylamine N-acetyltransferase [Streptomyces sp. NPDC041068]|uniref:arylamine N-acetyltransferase family protein n=1 Tax=Streptomyces sp. NPDC041068 TaxID=3155130 RepID=UPI0033EF5132
MDTEKIMDDRTAVDTDQIDAYLRHIGAARPTAPTTQALRDLHLAHVRGVPFENLSIHLGEDIALTDEALVSKVVDAHRGGFCYELNGAFAALLTALGFDVAMVQARVYDDRGCLGIPFDHMALRVRTEDGGDWLADVGFGAHSHLPLAFGDRGEQPDPGGTFRLTETSEGDLELTKDGAKQYLVDQRPRALADFKVGAWYHRTSPDSHFTKSLVCSIVTEEGRVTLSGRKLVVTAGEEKTTTELATEAEVLEAYDRYFRIALRQEPQVRTAG